MLSQNQRKLCRNLRKEGASLNFIVKVTALPKSTVYDQIKDIVFSKKAQKIFNKNHRERVLVAAEKRKGRCWRGRIVLKPIAWSADLLFVISHFLFDGTVNRTCCEYTNRSLAQIMIMKRKIKKIFGVEPKRIFKYQNGVNRIRYHYVEMGDYVLEKKKELISYIRMASLDHKKIFLKCFYDDEGCISLSRDWRGRRVRGYQHSREVLELVQFLLAQFKIKGVINKKNTEICISCKENLIKFQKEINFSPGIYINPNRKNSIWRERFEKREILSKAISSYLN